MSEQTKKLLVWLLVLVTVGSTATVTVLTTPNLLTADRIIYSGGFGEMSVRTTYIKEATTFPININTAEKEDFLEVPGIGEVYATRILEYRDENGGFSSLEELTAIKGIGEKRLEAWQEYLYCE